MFYQISIMGMESFKENEMCLNLIIRFQYNRKFGSTQTKVAILAALKANFMLPVQWLFYDIRGAFKI